MSPAARGAFASHFEVDRFDVNTDRVSELLRRRGRTVKIARNTGRDHHGIPMMNRQWMARWSVLSTVPPRGWPTTSLICPPYVAASRTVFALPGKRDRLFYESTVVSGVDERRIVVGVGPILAEGSEPWFCA